MNIFVWVNIISENSAIFMRYFTHNIENSLLVFLRWFDLCIVVLWFGRDNGIWNWNFTNLENWMMNMQTGPDPQTLTKPSVSFLQPVYPYSIVGTITGAR